MTCGSCSVGAASLQMVTCVSDEAKHQAQQELVGHTGDMDSEADELEAE